MTAPVTTVSQSSVPEELFSQLARAVTLASAYIPDDVCLERPRLAAVAARSGVEITRSPRGDEDLLCVLAERSTAETVRSAVATASAVKGNPFLLLIPRAADPSAALECARGVIATGSWLGRDLDTGAGAILLAPAERFLTAGVLPGAWYGSGIAANGADAEDAVELLWRAVDGEPDLLAEVEARIRAEALELRRLRAEHDRLRSELTRAGAANQRELDRMRLQLLEERKWVSEQAKRIADSTSWRLGHRLARFGRRLALKQDKGTNLPEKIARRMEEGPFR